MVPRMCKYVYVVQLRGTERSRYDMKVESVIDIR
jgi:hypothetical protein